MVLSLGSLFRTFTRVFNSEHGDHADFVSVFFASLSFKIDSRIQALQPIMRARWIFWMLQHVMRVHLNALSTLAHKTVSLALTQIHATIGKTAFHVPADFKKSSRFGQTPISAVFRYGWKTPGRPHSRIVRQSLSRYLFPFCMHAHVHMELYVCNYLENAVASLVRYLESLIAPCLK